MEYVVDIVQGIMEKISSSKPVMFQRDGCLQIASKEGLGLVTLGLETNPDYHWDGPKRIDVPSEEFLASQEAIKSRSKDRWNPKVNFIKGEGKYFAPLLFGSDDYDFTLESIAGIAETLGKLPDDGNIRMVGHSSGYHSNKHGYACDGIDVSIESARIMNKEKYLEGIRNKEKKTLEELPLLEKGIDRYGDHEGYSRTKLIQGVVITPNIMAMFPNHGQIEYHNPNVWCTEKRLRIDHNGLNRGGFLRYELPRVNDESPFALHVVLNKQNIRSSTSEEYIKKQTESMSRLNGELSIMASFMPKIEGYIKMLNDNHNTVFAKDLEMSRSIRERLSPTRKK